MKVNSQARSLANVCCIHVDVTDVPEKKKLSNM